MYTISYDLQGGTVSPDNPAGYTIESSDFTLTQPTRECYSFAGWTGTDLTEASTDVTILAGSTGNREYSAVWSVDVYTITYTLNNGSVTGNPDKYTVESGAITLNNPQRDGYQFDGWTGTGLTGKTQTVTIAQGSTGNREYTANFSPIQYTISYELNGGTASNPASYTIESGDITLSNPTRTGYTFDGWSGTGITGTSQTVTIAGHSTGNRSYTANWSLIQYGISYDLGGGTFSEDAQTTYNYETDTFTLNIPEREGYTFTGWSTEGRDELLQNVEIPQGSTDNRKYTAHWTAIIYTISYDLDGGTVSPDNPVSYDIESEDITLNNPTKDGYTFTGWTGTDIETASIDVIIPQGSTGNREYTATWSEDITPDSPDITPESPDIKPESPDIQPDSPDIKPTSPDITPTSPDVTPSTPAVLQTISVDISGSNTLITDVEHGASLTLTADISGNYSDGRTETLSPDSYTLTWGTDNTAEAISFSNGTLRVEQNAVVGAYEVNVTATAESGSIKGTSGRTVRVTVNNVIPELTMQTGSLTVKRGRRITNITVRAERGTQNLTWTTNGTLPEGLTGSANGETYVISGTVAGTAEIRDYPYVIKAANEAGEAEKNITITVSEAESVSGETIEIIPDEIAVMTDEELQEMVEGMTEIALTGKVENLSEVITRLETVTEIKTLDLSLVEGVEEVKLDETNKVETLTLTGNQSIQKVEVTGNTSLKSLNMAGSVIETVDAKWCENLTEVNLEGCENLSYLDVSETAITELNVADCKNLETLNCASCDISALNLEGCESLTDIDCQNNSLLILNASQFSNLNSLECRNQQVGNKPLARVFSFLDLLFGRGIFAASAGDDEVLENVSNLKVYDEAGNELTAELDDSGELSVNGDPAKITYDYDTGFNGVMMDVTVFAAETPDEETHEETAPVYGGGPGDPRGGCDSGFRVVAALMLLFTALTRKR